jgi:hypothetical protein
MSTGAQALLAMSAFALLAALLSWVAMGHFVGHSYRQDETALVNAAASGDLRSALDVILGTATSPGWFLPFDLWVDAFGHHETIVRYFSGLMQLLSLAFLYRLAADLFDRQTGLIAVATLGTWALFQFFAYEARHYSTLIPAICFSLWAFARWLRWRRWPYSLLVVASGIWVLYSHYFGVYVLAAEFALMFVLARWNPAFYARTAALFVAVGLSYSAWLLPFIYGVFVVARNADIAGIMPQATLDDLLYVYERIGTRPLEIGSLLLLGAAFIPLGRLFPPSRDARFYRWVDWRKGFIVGLLAALCGIILLVNQFMPQLQPRYLTILLPAMALVAAYAVRALPVALRIGTLIVLALPAVFVPRVFHGNGPYMALAAGIDETLLPDSAFILDSSLGWEHWPFQYYVQHRLRYPASPDRLLHWTLRENFIERPVFFPQGYSLIASAGQSEAFRAFVGDHEQLWHIRSASQPTGYEAVYLPLLAERYQAVRTIQFPTEDNIWGVSATEYRRLPEPLADMALFDDALTLRSWRLLQSVEAQPCENLRVESWWQARQTPQRVYSLALILVESRGGGIAERSGNPGPVWTNEWVANTHYLDSRALQIPCEAAPGRYDLLFAMRDYLTGENVPISTADGAPAFYYYLTTITVTQPE